ncbi:MAG: GHKL domain-containing protein [Pseudohongiella sp.]|nr:GHKL domain-containing protein [Pseudohongiella sp.]
MSSLINNLKGQHVKLVIQIALLLGATFLFAFSILQTNWIGTPVISFTLIVLITTNIIRISEKSNRDFAQFLSNVSHNDFSTSTATSSQGAGSRSFIEAQKILLGKYRKLKRDRSAQNRYLHAVVEHLDTALICFDSEGKIEFANEATSKLLNKRYISSVNIIGKLNKELGNTLRTIRAGDHVVLKTVLGNELQSLILTATEFILLEKKYKLVSLQNIKNALDEREIESWQKLIKVLTHEIMNSMTPIVSLSHYVKKVVSDKTLLAELADDESEQHLDLQHSIEAISSRSEGLMEFVNSYRSFSNLPQPNFASVKIEPLFQRIESLLKEIVESSGITFVTQIEPRNMTLTADVKLLEQVLINLISNAIDSLEDSEDPKIQLLCSKSRSGKILIQVKDNGCGISKDVMENIFTPFFTTKEKGSGIGLSLSRQLARLNKGTLTVSSLEDVGSQFTLSF